MSNYNEQEIAQQLQDPSKCRKAFEQVVKAYSEQLYWQIRRMVLSHDDANDLLQNTFIKAWSNLEYFRGDARLSTWQKHFILKFYWSVPQLKAEDCLHVSPLY